MARLFGVKLPQVTRYQLRSRIQGIENGAKHVLYWHYSEFLLRANRNPWYKNVLNRASFSAIDGKGLHWAMYKTMHPDLLPSLYRRVSNWSKIVRMPLFVVLFGLQLVWNVIHATYTLISKTNLSRRTKNQVILGREFSYELFKIAEERGWKTMIVSGTQSGQNVTQQLLHHLFPALECVFWTRPSDSDLMRDKQQPSSDISALDTSAPSAQLALPSAENTETANNRTQDSTASTATTNHSDMLRSGMINKLLTWFFSTFWKLKPILHSENLYQKFPDLQDARQAIIDAQPDLILVGIGGGSGKQEFFIDSLYTDPQVHFTLATGLGAAFDHLGGGAQQQQAPQWMQSAGLEWLFRVINQPYRIPRIIDSVATLLWWTTVEEYMRTSDGYRETAVNVVYKNGKNGQEFLLAQRRHVLPGDVAWTCVQGDIATTETTAQAGLRELQEEAGLSAADCTVIRSGIPGSIEPFSVSLGRFFSLGAKAVQAHNYINLIEYTGSDIPQPNWENESLSWVSKDKAIAYLSPEKREDFMRALVK